MVEQSDSDSVQTDDSAETLGSEESELWEATSTLAAEIHTDNCDQVMDVAARSPRSAPLLHGTRPHVHPHRRPGRRSATVVASHPNRSPTTRQTLASERMALADFKAEVEELLLLAQNATNAERRSSDEASSHAAAPKADTREKATQTPGRPLPARPCPTAPVGDHASTDAGSVVTVAAAIPSPTSNLSNRRLPPLPLQASLQTAPLPPLQGMESLPPLNTDVLQQAPPRLVPLSLQQIIREETAALQSEQAEFSPGGGTLRIPELHSTSAPLLPNVQVEPTLEAGLRMDGEIFGTEEPVALAVAVAAVSEPEPALDPPAEPSVATQFRSPEPTQQRTRSAEDEPTIIIVDGSPSSAKTGLLQKLRDLLPAPCLLISTKTFTDLLPEPVRNGRNGPEADAEWVSRCRAGMCGSLQALASSGNHLLIDFDWGDDWALLRSLCAALGRFQHPLFINAGSGDQSVQSAADVSLGSNQSAAAGHTPLVVYDFDLGSLIGMDDETKMNVLDAVVLAHLESRRMPATIHSPARRSGDRSTAADIEDSNMAIAAEDVEVERQTALAATLERLNFSADATVAAAATTEHASRDT